MAKCACFAALGSRKRRVSREATATIPKWKRMKQLEMAKWLIEVPMSFQLPWSLTRNRKLRLNTSEKAITNKKEAERDNPDAAMIMW